MYYRNVKNSHFLLYSEQYTQPEQLFDITYWQAEQRILGQANGRGVTWFIQAEDLILQKNLALRHYYRGGFIGKWNPDYFVYTGLTQTRSFSEFALLNQLHQAGLAVPQPIAAHVKRYCGYYTADIIVEYITNSVALTDYLQSASLSVQQWQQIGQLIRQMHEQQVDHTDLNAHNILIQQHSDEMRFYLIDFDKCAIKTGDNWKKENLSRLHRSFRKETARTNILFQEHHWQMLLDGYFN